jgi:hypothetical protein
VHLEASTKPHVHSLIREFLINMAFTMACPNFKKGLKMVFGPLGVKVKKDEDLSLSSFEMVLEMGLDCYHHKNAPHHPNVDHYYTYPNSMPSQLML